MDMYTHIHTPPHPLPHTHVIIQSTASCAISHMCTQSAGNRIEHSILVENRRQHKRKEKTQVSEHGDCIR